MWRPSCHHMWRWVIVSLDFFVAKPARQFCSGWVAFPAWILITHALGYRAVNHTVMVICADRAEWSLQIWWYNNSPPYVTVNIQPHSINTGVKRDQIPLFEFLGYDLSVKCSLKYSRKGQWSNFWLYRGQIGKNAGILLAMVSKCSSCKFFKKKKENQNSCHMWNISLLCWLVVQQRLCSVTKHTT